MYRLEILLATPCTSAHAICTADKEDLAKFVDAIALSLRDLAKNKQWIICPLLERYYLRSVNKTVRKSPGVDVSLSLR
jgi:hypothetical protein